MAFPELVERAKAIWNRFETNSQPLTLGLKGIGDWNPSWYYRNGFPSVGAALEHSGPGWANQTVTLDTALNHSVVFTCQRILAESAGSLPLMMKQQKGANKIDATEHPMYAALHFAPNEEITAQSFRETLMGHCVLGGNAYAQIIRRSGTEEAVELLPLLPAQVSVDREREGQKRVVYEVKDGNAAAKTYTVQKGKPQDVLHVRGLGWDGLRGYSILTLARHCFGIGLAAERNVARFYANGGRLPYYLQLDKDFETDQEADEFRADWEAIYSEPHRAPILPPWIKAYQQIGINAKDAQLLESRQFTVVDICRWFRMPPHLAGDLSRATFSNIEEQSLEFVNYTLMPWLTRWEMDLWRCVLTPEEKRQGYFFKHNVNALLRGDFTRRMAGYAQMLQNGIASINDVRALEDWNPIPGGDSHRVQLNIAAIGKGGGTPEPSAAAPAVINPPAKNQTAAA